MKMGSKSNTRSNTLKKRWKEGKFKERILKGIPHPWNKGKKGTFVKGHKHTEEVLIKISKTRIKTGVAKGEKNPFYIHGNSRSPYPQEFHKKREKILNRDKYICQLCKCKTIKNRSKNIKWASVHHIDYNKNHNNDKNLITLCNMCNLLVNTKRKEWTNFFQEKVNG